MDTKKRRKGPKTEEKEPKLTKKQCRRKIAPQNKVKMMMKNWKHFSQESENLKLEEEAGTLSLTEYDCHVLIETTDGEQQTEEIADNKSIDESEQNEPIEQISEIL